MQGKLLRTLADGETQAGNYQVSFDAGTYPPGAYYARLQNGSLQQVRTMMLVV